MLTDNSCCRDSWVPCGFSELCTKTTQSSVATEYKTRFQYYLYAVNLATHGIVV